MSEKSTKELADILGKTHLSEFDQYCKDHKESMKAGKDMFSIYIKPYSVKLTIVLHPFFSAIIPAGN